jgi:hypothetical protein
MLLCWKLQSIVCLPCTLHKNWVLPGCCCRSGTHVEYLYHSNPMTCVRLICPRLFPGQVEYMLVLTATPTAISIFLPLPTGPSLSPQVLHPQLHLSHGVGQGPAAA